MKRNPKARKGRTATAKPLQNGRGNVTGIRRNGAGARRQGSLLALYEILLGAYGPQGWWPADSTFEIIVGAILTQQTAWENVEKAIEKLKGKHLLTAGALAGADASAIESAVRICGFYGQKARYLRAMAGHISGNYGGDADALLRGGLVAKRAELLALDGVGEETADSILLYGAGKPVFVVDAYTRRLCGRLGLRAGGKYSKVQSYFMERLPRDVGIYQEFHALIVEVSKAHCKKAPACDGCPLAHHCARARREKCHSAKVNI